MSGVTKNWLAEDSATLPDFIIAGAMKCGTTSLHAMLNQHPDIFIPDKELHFFDMDDIAQHPDFNTFDKEHWLSNDLTLDAEHYWRWYSSNFLLAKTQQLIGEDSTTYLASNFAVQRIAMQDKKIKMIIMLRQPSARLYSHYWHMVKAGKAMFNFEDTLKFSPHNLLDRSNYLTQLKTLFSYIPKEQVKVILFEDFVKNKAETLKNVCEFIGVEADKLPSDAINIHANSAKIPTFIRLHLLKCRLFRSTGNQQSLKHFGNEFCKSSFKANKEQLFLERCYKILNPLVVNKPPKINASSKMFLDNYFKKSLQGIDEIVEQDVMSLWFK
ncbi:MAG: sulfotransferase [Colwellia sp.]|nr:sulfotransferase [Colwellia sp.]